MKIYIYYIYKRWYVTESDAQSAEFSEQGSYLWKVVTCFTCEKHQV